MKFKIPRSHMFFRQIASAVSLVSLVILPTKTFAAQTQVSGSPCASNQSSSLSDVNLSNISSSLDASNSLLPDAPGAQTPLTAKKLGWYEIKINLTAQSHVPRPTVINASYNSQLPSSANDLEQALTI